jgi:hypothetical protein
MPGLLRGIARTAVVAGTASAVAGRVRRHQDQHFAEQDAQAADEQQGYDQEDDSGQQIPEQRAAPSTSDMLSQLKQLGELKSSGVLTEQEFADQKAQILGG